jgi:signal transduction histidine kinase
MKLSKLILPIYIIVAFLFFFLLHILKIINLLDQIQYSEFIIDLINISLSILISVRIKNYVNRNFLLLPVVIIVLFLMDISYLLTFFNNFKDFPIFAIITYSWYLITILAFIILIIGYIYEQKEIKLIICAFLSIIVIIIIFFAPTYLRYLSYPYYSIDLTATITLFYLSILIIITVRNKYVLLGFSGFCFGMIGNFLMTECYLNNRQTDLIYGEAMWLIFELLVSFAMIGILQSKLYDPKKWFFNSKSIRNKQAFIIFHVSILGYILACIAMRELNILIEKNFVFIPSMGMIYSMIAAIFSVIAGNQMEKPFLIIKNNVTSLFEDKELSIKNELTLLEFKELQDFFIESYKYKIYIQKQVVSLATRVAHDIKSPVLIIKNLITTWSNTNHDIMKTDIIKQINKINYISRSMLKENKDFEDKLYGAQCIVSIVNDLISDKQIEWSNDCKIINLKYHPKKVIWLSSEQSKIKNILSNLINNAYEASLNENKIINIIINADKSKVQIQIQDFGCGIPESELENVLNGKSLKLNGNGIGLSSAKKFMKHIGGDLTIDSIINQSTTVNLIFPIISFPDQYAFNINILTDYVIVLDDNPNIINKWQEFFLIYKNDIKIRYFMKFSALKDFLLNEKNYNNITYLLDYNVFGEKLTAVNIIKEFNLEKVYLITNYAEDIKLQEEIKLLPIKLIPKVMLENNINIVNN